jgi:asparagine synthase (glutamine-hydrolysing)
MCGFAGEIVFGGGRADRDLAVRMAATLVHRGPDEAGSFLSDDGRCAIGCRRLAVIDPAGSHQPMTSADGRYTVAFNGEIYNFRRLRSELEALGDRFATAGDTEVLLHLYRRCGPAMLEQLDGMFAIALYDRAEGTVLLARDRLGQKPLWLARVGRRVLFASQARALRASGAVSAEVSHEDLTFYLTFGYVPAPRSLLAGLEKLQPGHYILLDGPAARPVRYWQPEPMELPPRRSEVLELVRAEVSRVVAAHMVADVPLGALLSGGIDSSIVVALMARAAGAGGGVKTFTAGFADSTYDERPAARATARRLRTDHTELLVEPDPLGMLDQVVDLYDEPLADASAVATLMICKAARRGVTVALAGDGGDEVFAGYDRYRAMHLAQRLGPAGYGAVRLAAKVIGPLAPHREKSRWRRLVRFADSLLYPPSVQYFMHRRLFGPDELERLLSPDFASRHNLDAPAEWFCNLYEQANGSDEVAAAQRHDMLTYLGDDLLVKTDIASMAYSLELRAPLLDHRLCGLGLGLPMDLKLNWLRGKLALREAFAGLVPPEVFRRPKRGFAVPLADWLRGPLREALRQSVLDSGFLAGGGILNPAAVRALVDEHLSGRADHSHRLWALMILARWQVRG